MELPYQVTISNIDDRYHIEQLYHQTQDAHILANYALYRQLSGNL